MTNQKLCAKKGIKCRQWTSANANIEHIEFYRMVSLEFGGPSPPPPPPEPLGARRHWWQVHSSVYSTSMTDTIPLYVKYQYDTYISPVYYQYATPFCKVPVWKVQPIYTTY